MRECEESVEAGRVEEVVVKCESDVKNAEEGDVEGLEVLLEEYGGKLHTNHYLLLAIRKKLAQAYTRKGETHVSRQTLEKRMKLAEQYICVYSVVDSGHTKWRATLLYEVVKVRLLLANTKFGQGEMDKDVFWTVSRRTSRISSSW